MTILNDINFLANVKEKLDEKRNRRARRLLALYMAGRTPHWKQTEEYECLCRCVSQKDADIQREIETQAMAASV